MFQFLRRKTRGWFFHLLSGLLATEDCKKRLTDSLQGLLRSPAHLPGQNGDDLPPYPEIGRAANDSTANERDAIFITGRFRSGSTLLWNLFRHIPGHTSYYEPLNERRWFDPATRGTHIDPTHRKVGPYWLEYEGLRELGAYYREEWTCKHLLMDADFWEPSLRRFVDLLIERAANRPVLQFNRIDFRLPWFRRQYPRARIVHLYRHPRDQWCSTLLNPAAFPKERGFADFARHDHFYLRTWARDLRHHFPFLEEAAVEHPYQLFYYVWKLSWLFGREFAHHSIKFEDLVADPDSQLSDLMRSLDVHEYDLDKLKSLMVTPALGKWRDYADDVWFRGHEQRCEEVLAEYAGAESDSNSSILFRSTA